MPWSVLLGGSGFEECEQWNQVCVAANGDVLLCGRTRSANFGPTSGPGLQGPEDGFVAASKWFKLGPRPPGTHDDTIRASRHRVNAPA